MRRQACWGVGLFMVGSLGAFACNDHVFRKVTPGCVVTDVVKTKLEIQKAADILVVVDNSASMCEEQQNLVDNFFDPDCDIDFASEDFGGFKNPSPEQIQVLAEKCGFIQMLALFENDFRVGVITTDVTQCDNVFNQAASGACGFAPELAWGNRPQRGCLQAPAGEPKFLTAADDKTQLGNRFKAILDNVRTFGSSHERGLDAVKLFLAKEDPLRHPSCAEDRSSFIRDEATLNLIFLTDEEDCSHEGAPEFPDELTGGVACTTHGTNSLPAFNAAGNCYAQQDKLASVESYTAALRNLKPNASDLRVAVIAGGVSNGQSVEPQACFVGGDGQARTECEAVRGGSNSPACSPEARAGRLPCCTADPGSRYYALADQVGARSLKDSICVSSFRQTMINIAELVARQDTIFLQQPPADPRAILVTVQRPGDAQPRQLLRVTDCATESGYQLEGNKVTFCGDAVPTSGDDVQVQALGVRPAIEGGLTGCELSDDARAP
jgi:hypothetical protein